MKKWFINAKCGKMEYNCGTGCPFSHGNTELFAPDNKCFDSKKEAMDYIQHRAYDVYRDCLNFNFFRKDV